MVNGDPLPGHDGIDAATASAHQEHTRRLAAVLDLAGGLAAILVPDKDSGEDGPTGRPAPILPAVGPGSGEEAAALLALRLRQLNLLDYLDQRSRTSRRAQETRRQDSRRRLRFRPRLRPRR